MFKKNLGVILIDERTGRGFMKKGQSSIWDPVFILYPESSFAKHHLLSSLQLLQSPGMRVTTPTKNLCCSVAHIIVSWHLLYSTHLLYVHLYSTFMYAIKYSIAHIIVSWHLPSSLAAAPSLHVVPAHQYVGDDLLWERAMLGISDAFEVFSCSRLKFGLLWSWFCSS